MNILVCNICGHIEYGSAPEKCPVCGASKEQFKQNNTIFKEAMEKSKEGAVKHIPSVTVNKSCGLIPENTCWDIIVRIGETLHPMEEKHFIQWMDCYVDDKFVSRIQLTPNVNPAGCFHLKAGGSKLKVVEMCNIHGHWQTEVDL